MIDLHYWPTPNEHKVAMFLEESRYLQVPGVLSCVRSHAST